MVWAMVPLTADAIAVCRIVDFGADTGGDHYRSEAIALIPADVDGDGQVTPGEAITGWPLRFDVPMNPKPPFYDETQTSAIFYGGIVGFGTRGAAVSEGMNNENHELRDDFNAMAQAVREDQKIRAHTLYFWDKRDFLNGGATNAVTFDAKSLFGPHISRFLNGIDDARWVVRDGRQFYISEARFATEEHFPDACRKGTDTSYMLSPTTTAWAPYDPKEPHGIAFEPATATFGPHDFADVTAVGFYIARNRMATGSQWIKWYAFEAYATVAAAPTHMAMSPLAGQNGAAVALSAQPVPYGLWRHVWRTFASNARCRDVSESYAFDRDGDMGSMDLAEGAHSAQEPVTDVTWLDAVVWCNALSEYEGREPCYYADEARSVVLRRVLDRDDPKRYGERPPVFWKQAATGYRLPTAAEWLGHAAGRPTETSSVREWCWDRATDEMPAGPERTYGVVGRDPWSAALVPDTSPLPYGEAPAEGSFRIGFRVARGVPATPLSMPPEAALWHVTASTFLPPSAADTQRPPKVPALAPIPAGGFVRAKDSAHVAVSPFHAATTETTFAEWIDTYRWAVRNGYRFDADGDMGSMGHVPGTHGPDEPVTNLCWEDMLLWCNALSERLGLVPCYTLYTTQTNVLRTAWRFRVSTWRGGRGYPPPEMAGREIHVRWHADGFRLPTAAEWQVAYRAGNAAGDVTVLGMDATLERGWLALNSGGKTQPVAQRKPNAFGLYDLEGNVAERVWDWPGIDYYRAKNPKGGDRPNMFGKLVFGSCFASRAPTPLARPTSELPSVPRPRFGFRVVRCDAGVHPIEEPLELRTVLNIDPARFDPLQGRVARGNLFRNGDFPVQAPPTLGKVRWEFKAGGAVRSGPVVADGMAVFGSDDGIVYALGADDGRPRWRFATKDAVRASVAIVDGTVYAASYDRSFYALNAADGTLRWKHTARSAGTTAPAVAYGVVFAGFGYGWSGELVGLDVRDGREVWRYRLDSVNGLPNGMAMDGERLVTPVDDIQLVAAELRTEYRVWRHTGTPTRSSVPIAGGRAYYAGEDRVAAFDVRTGERLWAWFPKGTTLRTTAEREPTSSPAVVAGVLFQGWFNGQVTAVSADKGEVRWVVPTGAPVLASPAVGAGVVFVANDEGVVLALDAATGVERSRHVLPAASRASPWLAEGRLYVASDDGTVRALE